MGFYQIGEIMNLISCIGHRQSQPVCILERIKGYIESLSHTVGKEINQALLQRKVRSTKLHLLEEAKKILDEATTVVNSAKENSSSLNTADLENLEDRMIDVLSKCSCDHGLGPFRTFLHLEDYGSPKRLTEPKTKAADRLKSLSKKKMKEMPSEKNKAKRPIHETEVMPLQRNEAKNLNMIPSSSIQPEAESESKHEILPFFGTSSASSIETEAMPKISHPLREDVLSSEKIKIQSISSKSDGMIAEESVKTGDRLKRPHLKQEIEEITFGKNKAKREHVAELNPDLSVPEGEAKHEAISRSESASISKLVDKSTSTSRITETDVMPPGRNEAISTYFDVHESIPLTEDEKKFNPISEIEEVPFDSNEEKTMDITGLAKMSHSLSIQDNSLSSSAFEDESNPTLEIAESSISSKAEGMLSNHGEENLDKLPSGTTGIRSIHVIEVKNVAFAPELGCQMKPEQSEISVEPTVLETTSIDAPGAQIMDMQLEIFQGDSSMKVHDVIKDPCILLLGDYNLSIRTTKEKIEVSPKMESDPSIISKEDASLCEPPETPKRTSFSLPKHSILRKAGEGLKEPPPETEWEHTSIVVLADNEFSTLPKKPRCPNLSFLFLQINNRLRTIPDLFFDGMASLRVLDLSKTRIRSLPPSLFKLTKLQVLFLRKCDCLDELPLEIGNLQRLEVLDIWGTELYNLPDEIGELICLKILQVSFYGSDDQNEYGNLPAKLISEDIVSKLTALQALSIAVHPHDGRWNKSAKAITKNVCMLNNLTYLEFYFPEVKFLGHFTRSSLPWRNRQLKFKFVVGQNIKRIVSRVPDCIESEYEHHDRCLKFVNGGEKPQEVVVEVLNRATGFYLDHHLAIYSLSEFGISDMEGLEFCLVRECPKIQVVIDNEEKRERVLPSLRHLSIHYLWELEIIWKGPVTNGSLGVLKVLSVHTCPKLEFIISQSMLQCLSKLEELVVEDCVSLKEVIRWDGNLVKDDFKFLPGLKKIKLHYLPELVSLWNGFIPLLKPNDIYGCPKLEEDPKDFQLEDLKKFEA